MFAAATPGLRALGRLALFVAAVVAAGVVAGSVVYPLIARLARAVGVRLNGAYWFPFSDWLSVGAALLATAALLFWVDRGTWADVGLGRAALAPRGLAAGTLLGAAAIGVPSLLLVAGQALRIVPAADGSWIATALVLLGRLAPAALLEELLFRGYPFTALHAAAGALGATLVTSVLFGLVHITNPGASALSIAMVVLAGVFLSGVRLATGSVYAATAAHLAWNWTLAGLLHTPVSGLAVPLADYRTIDVGADWLTGGAWGPEGGVPAGLGMLAATALLGRAARRRGLTLFSSSRGTPEHV